MSLFKRGNVWWYKFRFSGQVIRESTKTHSKTVARAAEEARRRELVVAVNRIPKRERLPLFSVAARAWLNSKTGLDERSLIRYRQCVGNLTGDFRDRLICDVTQQDIADYQRKRLAAGKSPRTVNYEVGTLRGILRHFGLWGPLADRVKSLRELHDVGRALSEEDEDKLIKACQQSRSPAILPLFVLSLDSGLRASEIRRLRRQDLNLSWQNGVITGGEIVVGKSKTPAGTGRTIPLSKRACGVLTLWLSRFPDAGPDGYVFPRHRVNMGWNSHHKIYGVDLRRPMGSWKTAWSTVCRRAGVHYRWHDLRHTFVSRLAEDPNVSEATIRSLAGHVSQRMLQRYSHIRVQAKQAAIASLDQRSQQSGFITESRGGERPA
ncbi:MAG: site-specific integrase [Acidobacteria bacterium]|nr:site-specific integrase [Acidobacteriota bacterium]